MLKTTENTFVSSFDSFVDQFERMMQNITAAKKGSAIVYGTSGLQVSLRLAGVKAGDEVLTKGLTFVATANSIAYNNAHPVFLDVDLDTTGLFPVAVANFLDENAEMREGVCFNKKTNRKIAT